MKSPPLRNLVQIILQRSINLTRKELEELILIKAVVITNALTVVQFCYGVPRRHLNNPILYVFMESAVIYSDFKYIAL